MIFYIPLRIIPDNPANIEEANTWEQKEIRNGHQRNEKPSEIECGQSGKHKKGLALILALLWAALLVVYLVLALSSLKRALTFWRRKD